MMQKPVVLLLAMTMVAGILISCQPAWSETSGPDPPPTSAQVYTSPPEPIKSETLIRIQTIRVSSIIMV